MIEESTVKSHVTQIRAKLGARNRVRAVIHAYARGMGRGAGARGTVTPS